MAPSKMCPVILTSNQDGRQATPDLVSYGSAVSEEKIKCDLLSKYA
jgi:hypothetical protein